MAVIKDKKAYERKAINALYAFSRAMSEGELSTQDLLDAMASAFSDGWDMLEIGLAMAVYAVPMAHDKRQSLVG